jgi:hypothetical protein
MNVKSWGGMGISLGFQATEEFLHCRASGMYSFEDGCWMLDEVVAESTQRGATRVLVDCLLIVGSPTMFDRYALAEFLAQEVVGYIIAGKIVPRLAILGREPLVDPNRFGELVARNRGVQTKTVEQMEDAVSWLGAGGNYEL